MYGKFRDAAASVCYVSILIDKQRHLPWIIPSLSCPVAWEFNSPNILQPSVAAYSRGMQSGQSSKISYPT